MASHVSAMQVSYTKACAGSEKRRYSEAGAADASETRELDSLVKLFLEIPACSQRKMLQNSGQGAGMWNPRTSKVVPLGWNHNSKNKSKTKFIGVPRYTPNPSTLHTPISQDPYGSPYPYEL